MKKIFSLSLSLVVALAVIAQKQSQEPILDRGYYKDIFMDSGIHLSSKRDLPSARLLNLQQEYFAGERIAKDTIFQNAIYEGTPEDENGVLLYPDGAPRFRMVYVNGGLAETHGRSLSDKARHHYRDFIQAGGSYLGSCAGAYLACTGVYKGTFNGKDSIHLWPHYLGLWPGNAIVTGIVDNKTDVILEKNSPLKKYYDFGQEGRITDVYHNGGCMADEEHGWPAITEVLARFDTKDLKTKKEVNGKPVIWAYKASAETGRVMPCGSHPESNRWGPKLFLMASMVQYALDGNGVPRIKASLELDKERKMTASTHDNNPAFTKIGDKQYHHFIIDVPEGQDSLVIQLTSIPDYTNFDMGLFLNPDKMAWKEDAQYQNMTLGFDKTIGIEKPKAGRYYVAVYCATTVDTQTTAKGTQYYGRVDVLNGVPYIIKAYCPKKK